MQQTILEMCINIIGQIVTILVGIALTWVIAKIGKNEKFKTIALALDGLNQATQTTVLELQQTMVQNIKNASADGKLSSEEINMLSQLLLEKTLDKMNQASINVLQAANVDINAAIIGAGEALISQLHEKSTFLNDKKSSVNLDRSFT